MSINEQKFLILMRPNVSGGDFQGTESEREIRAKEIDEGCVLGAGGQEAGQGGLNVMLPLTRRSPQPSVGG